MSDGTYLDLDIFERRIVPQDSFFLYSIEKGDATLNDRNIYGIFFMRGLQPRINPPMTMDMYSPWKAGRDRY